MFLCRQKRLTFKKSAVIFYFQSEIIFLQKKLEFTEMELLLQFMNFLLVYSVIDKFIPSQLRDLIKCCNDNFQIYRRWAAYSSNTKIAKVILQKFIKDFDFDKSIFRRGVPPHPWIISDSWFHKNILEGLYSCENFSIFATGFLRYSLRLKFPLFYKDYTPVYKNLLGFFITWIFLRKKLWEKLSGVV